MKRLYLQIPTYLVRNEGVKLNATDFSLACLLKNLVFTSGETTFDLDHISLKHILAINDSRVLKASFGVLYNIGIIKNEVMNFPRKGPLTIEVNQEPFGRKPFAQLPSHVLTHINIIGHVGLRLLFYYESYINRGQLTRQFCFSSYKTIAEVLGISQVTLNKYNGLLVKSDLLSIIKSILSTDYSYTDKGLLAYSRYNNHYTPNPDKM